MLFFSISRVAVWFYLLLDIHYLICIDHHINKKI